MTHVDDIIEDESEALTEPDAEPEAHAETDFAPEPDPDPDQYPAPDGVYVRPCPTWRVPAMIQRFAERIIR